MSSKWRKNDYFFFQKIKTTKQIPMCEVQTNLALGLKLFFSLQTPGYAPDQDHKFS